MKNKKAIIGDLLVAFIAISMIVVILTIFVLGATIVKKIDGSKSGLVIATEKDIGIGEVYTYMQDYAKIVSIRNSIAQGNKELNRIIEQTTYEG